MVNPNLDREHRVLPCAPESVDDFLSLPTPAVCGCLTRHPGPILVLGAGGKIGLHLSMMVQQAFSKLGRRDPVIAVSRFRTLYDQADFEQRGVKTLVCDLERPAELAMLPDASIVFFLAGVKFGTTASPDLLQRLNVEMPRRVAERFKHSTIVVFSSGCVYPFVEPTSGGAIEETTPAPLGDYAASCLARENAFAEMTRRCDGKVVLIRLNYSVEFRYGLLVDIAQRVLRNDPVDVTMGYANVIWQRDAVAYALQALDVAARPAVPLNVTGTGVLSVRELAQCFGKLLNKDVTIAGREAETAWLSNASRAHQLFGPPATLLDDMVTWVADWLCETGVTLGKPTGFERRDGRY